VKWKSYVENSHGIGFSSSRNCIKALTWVRIYCVFTQKLWNLYWKGYMKGFLGVTLGGDLYYIELSPRATQNYVKKCDQCQRYAQNIHQPGGVMNPLSNSWPFAQWGLDIVGPFLRAAGNRRWLFVETDYFTKWVKVEPLSNIRDVDAKRFI